MIAIMWQFDVKNGREKEFEQLYGADGEWTMMNRPTRSYIGTSFLASLEARRTELVESVEPLGIFTALNVPDRWGPAWSQRDTS